MKKKIALLLAVLLVLSLGLSACGKAADNSSNGSSNNNIKPPEPPEPPVTAESLIKGFAAKTGAGTGVTYSIDLAMKMSVSVMGQNQSMNANGTLKTESREEIAHVYGTMTTDAGEGREESSTDTWTVKDGDKFISYTNVDGTWYKQELDTKGSLDSLKSLIAVKDISKLQLTEDGSEYHIDGTIDIGAMIDMIKEVMGSMEDMGDFGMVDLSGVAPANVSYRFDKSTKDLIYSEIDMKESFQGIMDNVIRSMLDALSYQVSEEGDDTANPFDGIDLSSLFKVETEEFKVILKDIKVDPELKLVLPEEAKNASEMPNIVPPFTPDDLEENMVEEMSIFLPSEFIKVPVEGYTQAFSTKQYTTLVLREDKSLFGNYAENIEEYLQLLIKANAGKDLHDPKYENGHPYFEYEVPTEGVTYRYYSVVYESKNAFWMVQFACDKSIYDASRPYFVTWADTVTFYE